MKALARLLGYSWQLPQNLAGALLSLFMRPRSARIARAAGIGAARVDLPRGTVALRCFTRRGGVSLGRYLFVHFRADEALLRHEHGHSLQSRLLGPLYLPIVGIPSIAWALLYPLCRRLRPRLGYFSFYTEAWADRLAGIERREEDRHVRP